MLPDVMEQTAESAWQKLLDKYPQADWLNQYRDDLKAIFALSDFIADACLADLTIVELMLSAGQLQQHYFDYAALLSERLADVNHEADFHQVLRQFRRTYMVHIGWRDLLNKQTIESSLEQVSDLANALISQAYHWLYQQQGQKLGFPQGEFGQQPMLIMGMGKLGGNELNFSSDIDLIFVYPENGEIDNGKRSTEHQQFFIKLAQKLIGALHQITVDGQVFRVDMRLRPYGDSGALVSHFAAFEDYYQDQGRDWERYAMVKGRVINPDGPYSDELMHILQPFVYRRYIDFGAIEALRKMKRLISQEVRRRGLHGNIKLGQGGIREVEFVVQSLQLIRGGRIPALQQQSLLKTLQALQDADLLPKEDVIQIRQCYLFLRKVEQSLQQFADQQTQQLPSEHLEQTRLAHVMGFNHYEDFLTHLNEKMQLISQQFKLLIGEEAQHQEQPEWMELADLWTLSLDMQEAMPILQDCLSEEDIQAFWPFYADFREEMQHRPIGQRGRESLDKLMPAILHTALHTKTEDYSQLLQRLFQVIKSICRRTAYLELLVENPGAMQQLIRLCNASPWIAEQLSRFPLLLDELLNPASLYQTTDLRAYPDELRQFMLRISPDDLELQMETLRQFKLTQQLKIAAADVTGALPVMKVSDHLTYLAEAIINQTVLLAWEQMVEKHGLPQGASAEQRNFAVLGYGKLGGIELGYGSDLDLVFVQNCPGNELTDGVKPIESRQFYIRLAQRIMHLFATKTASGELYEVDLRLRPSGNSGMLVCHVDSFAQYQREEAWTWEHQALVRSRFIFGETDLAIKLANIRHEILSRPRDLTDLTTAVVEMREKMRRHLSKSKQDSFDLKQDEGGIADIEFFVQYMVLAYSHQHSGLIRWPDNVRIIEGLIEVGLVEPEEAQQLIDAYLEYRNLGHHLALQNKQIVEHSGRFDQLRQSVSQIWNKYLAESVYMRKSGDDHGSTSS
ncbi:bifunctional [glutamate--ammonia ligase]-adenylyl-L-tyrosine phosphorylase/[glutamate--ammonia-ligase] adenylyltransferase [Neptunicella sp.]|uniref:bifunctional [glutamate--ammonia ligase]-adenylyl-L-tyrosine phosphorylase/[glutamate--ammonia-ligase] adenylyltransferase n=1 Tax=Neptunicella sp. TaxID=2125986 RepID=UPI003F6910D0